MQSRKRSKDLAQAMMETNLMARLYESPLWRRDPLLVFLLGITFRKEYQLISRALKLTGNESILDLACGPGIYTRRFAREVKQGNVIGFDLSWPMLKHGKQLLRKNKITNISMLQGDALTLPFRDQHFDVVNCAAALHLFGNLTAAFSEVSRVLKPGGRFTFSTFRYPKNSLITPFLQLRHSLAGIRSFRQDEIQNELRKAGFSEIRYLHAKRVWMVISARSSS